MLHKLSLNKALLSLHTNVSLRLSLSPCLHKDLHSFTGRVMARTVTYQPFITDMGFVVDSVAMGSLSLQSTNAQYLYFIHLPPMLYNVTN
jgi:hypothetical protein